MDLEARIATLVASVPAVDEAAAAQARALHHQLAKPRGSLGRVEEVGVQLAAIAGACPPPPVRQPEVVVCAGDHGVLAQGVSPWPQEITALMVQTFCAGKAAINVLARTLGARVTVLDVGVAGDLPQHPGLRSAKVARGTKDLSCEPALTREQAALAVLAGVELVAELCDAGVDLVIGGDMGIGNTTSSACMTAVFTGRDAVDVTGRGTGIDDAMLELKVRVVGEALELHGPDPADPLGVLAAVGGAEHAALCGIYLGAAAARMPIMLDGVTANAAALAAVAFAPRARDYMLAGHRSVEPAASIALAALDRAPLLDLGLRLGEGTGALLALALVRSAAAILRDMATLAEIAPPPGEKAPAIGPVAPGEDAPASGPAPPGEDAPASGPVAPGEDAPASGPVAPGEDAPASGPVAPGEGALRSGPVAAGEDTPASGPVAPGEGAPAPASGRARLCAIHGLPDLRRGRAPVARRRRRARRRGSRRPPP